MPHILSVPVPLLALTPRDTRNESSSRILFSVKLRMLESECVELNISESVCVKLHVLGSICLELCTLESMCVQLCVLESMCVQLCMLKSMCVELHMVESMGVQLCVLESPLKSELFSRLLGVESLRVCYPLILSQHTLCSISQVLTFYFLFILSSVVNESQVLFV